MCHGRRQDTHIARIAAPFRHRRQNNPDLARTLLSPSPPVPAAKAESELIRAKDKIKVSFILSDRRSDLLDPVVTCTYSCCGREWSPLGSPQASSRVRLLFSQNRRTALSHPAFAARCITGAHLAGKKTADRGVEGRVEPLSASVISVCECAHAVFAVVARH